MESSVYTPLGPILILAKALALASLSRAIEEMIENFEPRARVETVECIPKPDTYTYDIIIYFYVENLPAELQEFQTVLETMR